jgi:hypothetical protein
MWKSIGKQGSFLSEIIICPIDIGDLVGNFVFGNGTYYFAGPSPGQSLCPSLLPLPNFPPPNLSQFFVRFFKIAATGGGDLTTLSWLSFHGSRAISGV